MKRAWLLLALLTAPARAPAWAPVWAPVWANEAWEATVLGPYDGPVMNAGRREHLATRFEFDSAGHLIGHYHVDDVPPFDGELTDFRPDGDAEGDFTWRDPYGQGVVHIRFDPEHGRFFGRWGIETPLPQNIFDGFRTRPPAVS
jgi:hypothetical protein